MSLDDFIARFNLAFPTQIKIDVDGLEPEIIRGAARTLSDHRVKSVSIEINEKLPADLELVERFNDFGLRIKHKKHAEALDGGPWASFYNYVFERS
jgi:hypothetical protein